MQIRKTSIVWLACGVASSAFLLGYLTGGSATPVVQYAIAAVAALNTGAFAIAGLRLNLPKPDASLTDLPGQISNHSALRKFEQYRDNSVLLTGILLVAYSVPFLGGSWVGAVARNQQWFLGRHELPWKINSSIPKPATQAEAEELLARYNKLLRDGLREKDARELLALPRAPKPIATPKDSDLAGNGKVASEKPIATPKDTDLAQAGNGKVSSEKREKKRPTDTSPFGEREVAVTKVDSGGFSGGPFAGGDHGGRGGAPYENRNPWLDKYVRPIQAVPYTVSNDADLRCVPRPPVWGPARHSFQWIKDLEQLAPHPSVEMVERICPKPRVVPAFRVFDAVVREREFWPHVPAHGGCLAPTPKGAEYRNPHREFRSASHACKPQQAERYASIISG